jgi:PiT family inorganic phosphate transporter
MGNRLTDIVPPQGFAAEASSTAVILNSAQMGFALSTTHVVAGSVLGTGVGRRLAEVRWSVAGQMALTRLLTLPAAAAVGAVARSAPRPERNPMHIDWSALGEVAVVSIAVAVAVIFTLGILALSHRETEIDRGGNGTVALTGAVLCFAACAIVVLYSIYPIVSQLHH